MTLNTLVLSGGSEKGYCYIGVTRYLEEQNELDSIRHFSGTSIGSIFCLLLIIGFTSKEMEKLFLNLELKTLYKNSIENLIDRFGFDSKEGILCLLRFCMEKKGFDPNATIEQLNQKTGKFFSCNGTVLESFEEIIFDQQSTPGLKVLDAIEMSINLPLVFTKKLYNGKPIIDGGLSNNFMLNYYLTPNYTKLRSPETELLGVYLETNPKNTMDPGSSVFSYTYSLLHGVYNSFSTVKRNVYKAVKLQGVRTVFIELTGQVTNVSLARKKELVQIGYESLKGHYHEKSEE